jgi:hypothetical protein
MKKIIVVFVAISIVHIASPSYSWHDRTHIAIAKAAEYRYWFNSAGADMTKVKSGDIEEKNHYFNNNDENTVTDQMVLGQARCYNSPSDTEGHLYGAIIAAIREYQKNRSVGKYAEYHMAFAAHYIGDLSQPLHNMRYDNFNKAHHGTNDGIVDNEVLDNIGEIQRNMYEIKIRPDHYEDDLAKEIARIANISRMLGAKLKLENRDMTRGEAFLQLGHSASLLKAALGAK